MQKYGYSMNCPGCRSVMTNTTARAHIEECRKRLESCLAEDEETKFRSEAAKLRVDIWRASRVESTEKPRSDDAVSQEPSGAASSSAPAAAASGSVPMAASSSSANERFRSDEFPDHGVKRKDGRLMSKTRKSLIQMNRVTRVFKPRVKNTIEG